MRAGSDDEQVMLYRQLMAKFENLKAILPQRQSELRELKEMHSSQEVPQEGGNEEFNEQIEKDIAALKSQIKAHSSVLQEDGDPLFEDGGLAHSLYEEKTKHDKLQEEYSKQKEARKEAIKQQKSQAEKP